MADNPLTLSQWDSSGQITSTGSADAYIVTISQPLNGYYQGMPQIRFKANFTNVGSATVNIVTENQPAGLGAVTMKKSAGASNLGAGDIVSGGIYTLSHDGTFFQVLELNSAGVADNSVTNAKLADMAQSTIKGRAAGAGTGDPTDLSVAQVLAIIGALTNVNIQVFTATGANTYTPTAGIKRAIVISTGAGGGGGGADSDSSAQCAAAAGGAAGGTAIEQFDAATIGASQTVTIGTGGAGGAATGGNGTAGGNTTFGALHTATGGALGGGIDATGSPPRARCANGSAGGVPTGGFINITGGDGQAGFGVSDTIGNATIGGLGGASFWGGGGQGARAVEAQDGGSVTTAGTVGGAYGSGGGGAVSIGTTAGSIGGAGANGICVVLEFIN